MVRVFIAVEPAKEIRDKLEEAGMSLRGSAARLALPTSDQMHITLKFLGEVPEKKIPKISEALEKVKSVPFQLQAAKVSTFGKRVIKAEVTDQGCCADIAKQIDVFLLPLGFPKEARPFSPHITLARIKEYAPDLQEKTDALCDAEFGTCMIEEILLKQSTLTPRGSIYTTLARVKL
ncbi:RNA 2',3'-cyclic phosphodiesterase [uncultured Methanocorpusculum sp.]|nr:RNA 2',3'-cyclic phosphodiesterase [uncultured Methanocorpusculum sp.]